MCCPFLREGRARYCNAAPIRKLILSGPGAMDGGKCLLPEHRDCALLRLDPGPDRCPHLEEIHVQYCGAAPVAQLVPFSESGRSRCNNGSYRYCETYLGRARPHPAAGPPPGLLFSPNHLWLDTGEDGLCHIGLDGFLVNAVGSVDSITFVTPGGTRKPTVTLQVNQVEWPLTFPNPIMIQSVNSYLQSDPHRLTADPYGGGWLFQGWEVPGRTRAGLIGGDHAAAWQQDERDRLTEYIHAAHAEAADGGEAMPGLARHLSRRDAVTLFQQFFGRTTWNPEE